MKEDLLDSMSRYTGNNHFPKTCNCPGCMEIRQAVELDIKTKTWHSRPCFMCPHCPFDSLMLSVLLEHIKDHKLPVKQKVSEKILDSRGNKYVY